MLAGGNGDQFCNAALAQAAASRDRAAPPRGSLYVTPAPGVKGFDGFYAVRPLDAHLL